MGAGDYKKQEGQLGGPVLQERLDYCFSENGVHAFHGTKEIHCKSIVDHLGEDRWAAFEAGIKSILEAERETKNSFRARAARARMLYRTAIYFGTLHGMYTPWPPVATLWRRLRHTPTRPDRKMYRISYILE